MLTVFIDKIEENKAELHFDDGQMIIIDVKFLPKEIKEGNYLNVDFFLNKTKEDDVKENVAELISSLTSDRGEDFDL